MNNETYLAFLEIWNNVMIIGAVALFVAAVMVLIFHKIRVASTKDLKKKYDYLSQHSIKMQMRSVWFFSGAVLFALNTVYQPTMEIHYVWFFVRLFITFCVATLIVYISYLMYKYSYPAKLDKRLKELRYTPRISSKGHKMRLLSEEEEDVHLDEGMQAEEDVFSVDYDVWVDEETGEIKIEKYAGRLEANKCNTCGFYTMKLKQEEIIEPATNNSEGEMIQHWACSYCGAKRTKPVKIARLEEGQEFKLPKTLKFKDGKQIDAVKVHVHLSDGSTNEFDFQSAEQASKFLDKYQDEIDAENAMFKG
jgi:Ca2+/Na+ antiporter